MLGYTMLWASCEILYCKPDKIYTGEEMKFFPRCVKLLLAMCNFGLNKIRISFGHRFSTVLSAADALAANRAGVNEHRMSIAFAWTIGNVPIRFQGSSYIQANFQHLLLAQQQSAKAIGNGPWNFPLASIKAYTEFHWMKQKAESRFTDFSHQSWLVQAKGYQFTTNRIDTALHR